MCYFILNCFVSFLNLLFQSMDVLLQRFNHILQLHFVLLHCFNFLILTINLLVQAVELQKQTSYSKIEAGTKRVPTFFLIIPDSPLSLKLVSISSRSFRSYLFLMSRISRSASSSIWRFVSSYSRCCWRLLSSAYVTNQIRLVEKRRSLVLPLCRAFEASSSAHRWVVRKNFLSINSSGKQSHYQYFFYKTKNTMDRVNTLNCEFIEKEATTLTRIMNLLYLWKILLE